MQRPLKEILNKIKFSEISGSEDKLVKCICYNSLSVETGSTFVAIRGTNVDGHDFIAEAIKKGAVIVVCEIIPDVIYPEVTYIKVADSSISLAQMCSAFYDFPSSKLKLIGITGTNGKTTIATLLYRLFRELGYKTGLISTISCRVNDKEFPSTHTTPDPLRLNTIINEMVNEGCEYCFMEVSSHAVVQHRICGQVFTGGVFTNMTHDHLDYHNTFQNYIKAKKTFFDNLPSDAFALTNIDDKNGFVMIQNTKAAKFTYGLKNTAEFNCRLLENHIDGIQLKIDGCDIWCKLPGEFNAYNLTAIYSTAILLKQNKMQVMAAISGLDPVEGRFELVRDTVNNIVAIIDYAHTPDALKNVLSTIIEIRSEKGNIITIVGAGGNRDKSKRPEMGKIAAQLSDKVIFTSDNPRDENPETIIDEMVAGVDAVHKKKSLIISNRKEAIKTAYSLANKGDIILIAGKGHEKYQEINGVKYPFDDKQIIQEIINL